jgi:hypothetical protein
MNEKSKSGFATDAAQELKRLTESGSKKFGELATRVKKHNLSRPEVRARAAGRYLARLATAWGILSIIGAVIMMFVRTCIDQSDWSDTCYEYEHPFVTWAIVSLLANLIVSSFMYAVGTYIEAKMSKALSD